MNPVMIIPPRAMTAEDIALLNANDLCVVVAKDPALVRFIDPLPAISSRNQVEHAAIQLSRCLLKGERCSNVITKSDVAVLFTQLLLEGVPLGLTPNEPKITTKPEKK